MILWLAGIPEYHFRTPQRGDLGVLFCFLLRDVKSLGFSDLRFSFQGQGGSAWSWGDENSWCKLARTQKAACRHAESCWVQFDLIAGFHGMPTLFIAFNSLPQSKKPSADCIWFSQVFQSQRSLQVLSCDLLPALAQFLLSASANLKLEYEGWARASKKSAQRIWVCRKNCTEEKGRWHECVP